jgi:hypothetical protein
MTLAREKSEYIQEITAILLQTTNVGKESLFRRWCRWFQGQPQSRRIPSSDETFYEMAGMDDQDFGWQFANEIEKRFAIKCRPEEIDNIDSISSLAELLMSYHRQGR